MKDFIKNYFTFNQGQRKGILILLSLIFLVLLFLFLYDRFNKPEKVDFTEFEKQINDHETSDSLNVNPESKKIEKSKSGVSYFEFDPNTLSVEGWKKLGLSDKQIKVITNYLSKGGKFKRKEDLKKIYGISEAQYNDLEPYIVFENSKAEVKPDNKEIKPEERSGEIPRLVELNTADSSRLVMLYGVGPTFAKRIIQYRTRLGGFVEKEQLLEVFGFKQENLDQVYEFIRIDDTKVKRININKATADELKSHPYIKYNIANSIVNYRLKHGPYRTVSDIQNSLLVNEELYLKIAPYLTVE